MNLVPGYYLEKKIYESSHTVIFRGQRMEDKHPVTLKVLKSEYPTSSEILRFENEYNILSSIDSEGVIKVNGLEEINHGRMIVFEDFQGLPLQSMVSGKGFPVGEFLRIAIQLVKIISNIHKANIIHKDINPSNILLNVTTNELKIIDFGTSTALSHEIPSIKAPNLMEGTLGYISPEQTGRMNRLVDYRTDFYSLGATFYHLIMGMPPFDSEDPLELIHAHIAKTAIPPHIIDQNVPIPVSNIIMKLLAKNAEDRYQTCHGLLADLENCSRQWKLFGKIEPFTLSQKDFSDKLQPFQKLYGLEKEKEFLIREFEDACEGKRKLLFVSGYAGIGKTSLVNEIHRPILLRRGFFISGKFDQFQRDMPYFALTCAFRKLVQQLLMEDQDRLKSWGEKLHQALGPNAQILIDFIPELELIVGGQLPVPILGPAETQNRFNLVFQNFIRIFCQPEHPLVIFLDDLQWADSASLKLIEILITDEKNGNLFIIGAYRDNEVTQEHALLNSLRSLENEGVEFVHRKLSSLKLEHIHQWLSEILHSSKEQVKGLGELVFKKTGGNPFFTSMFLNSLYTEKHLFFNLEKGLWQWNLSKIQNLDITDNVVDLLALKVKRFKSETQWLLKLCSCLGTQFSIKSLAAVSDKTSVECINLLQEPITEGILLPLGYDFISVSQKEEKRTGEDYKIFRFSHDKIRKVIYSMIEAGHRSALHFNIGQYLLEKNFPEKQPGIIFEIVNQLNLGVSFVASRSQKVELAGLNLKAGMKAKASAAYESALNYFQAGIDILPEEAWNINYEITLSLFVEATEAAYLSGQYERMEAFTLYALNNSRELLDKVKIFEIKIQALNAQYKLGEAISTAKNILRLLEVNFPEKLNYFHVVRSFLRIRLMIAGKRIERLSELPSMKDPLKLATMRIMMSVGSAAYFADPVLFRYLVFKVVKYSLKHGNAPESPVFYTIYGMVLCGIVGYIGVGHRFGLLALKLLQKSGTHKLLSRTTLMVYAFVHHWKAHIRETLDPLEKAYFDGLETGDLEYASFSIFFLSFYTFVSGKKLFMVEQLMEKNSDTIRQLKHETSWHMHEIYRQTVANLLGNNENTYHLAGDIYDEQQMLPVHMQANDRTTLCNLYFNKLFICYIFGQYQEAVKNAELAEQYLDSVIGAYGVPLVYFFDSLSRLALFSENSDLEKAGIKRRIAMNQKKMRKWAHHAPMNHLHKYLLVEAERYRISGKKKKAEINYEKAINLARQEGYIHEQAIADELAAKFYFALGDRQKAVAHLKNARYGFLNWGAIAKVRAIDELYDQIPADFQARKEIFQYPQENSLTTSTYRSFEKLDFASVMKASQSISSEIVLNKLLDQLMKIIIQNTGAQKGVLILESAGKLMVEAELTMEQENAGVLLGIPLENCQTIPLTIVNYVARTKKYVVLDNAFKEGPFRNDPQILTNCCKSIFCGPILYKSRLLGVLYLENNLVMGAFNFERIEIIKLLVSQVSISLENARLYSNLEESELRYRQLYENIVDMVILIDRDDQVIMANPRFYSMMGIEDESIHQREKNFKTWVLSDDLPLVQLSMLNDLHGGKEVKDFHFRLQSKKGQIFDVECNAKCIRKESELIGYQMVIRDITARKRLEKELFDSIKEVENARAGTILGLAKLAEYRDEATGAHLERIREYTLILTKELAKKAHYQDYITSQYIDDIYFSSILHDIGKVGIPDSILLKPGRLTRKEFEIIKRHSSIGGDVLKQVSANLQGRSFLTIGMHIAYFHHEKWDGTGYPNGLQKYEIPLSARIVALADVYDALTSKRIYKEAYSHEQAREIIVNQRGKHFDPEIVDSFLEHEDEFDWIRKELQSEEDESPLSGILPLKVNKQS